MKILNNHRGWQASVVRLFPVLIIGLMLLVTAGCQNAAPGKDVEGGTYYQNIAAPPDRVTEAARQVLGEMGYQAWSDQQIDRVNRLEYRTSFDTRIIVSIATAGKASSRVGVLVTPGNSEGLSQNVLKRIDERATGIR